MTAVEGPLASPGFWLLQAALRWKVEFNRAARELDLTHAQFQVLAGIGWCEHVGARATQQHVAAEAGVDKMMASKIISGLVERGLVERSAAGREKLVALTPAGRVLGRRATAVARATDARLFADPGVREVLRAVATSD